jgi:hypothetical protein
MDLIVTVITFLFCILAGTLGAMLGLGGGVFLIIYFILALGLPVHEAVAMSLLAVIATSSVAGSVYLRDKITNIRLAVVLETCTVTGAVLGTFIALFLPAIFTEVILGIVLFYVAIMMLRSPRSEETVPPKASRYDISGEVYDAAKGRKISYQPIRLRLGLLFSALAGAVSGIVGIGGGVIKVPVMNIVMKIPIRAAAATSNFMVGVTAAASAYLYFRGGYVDIYSAVPVVFGIMVGAYEGTRLAAKAHSLLLRRMMGLVLIFFALVLLLRAGGILPY